MCQDKGYVVIATQLDHRPVYGPCECRVNALDAQRLRYSELPHNDASKTFGGFDLELQPEAFEVAGEFATGETANHLLTLVGPNGTGKSHLAEAIGRDMLEQGYIVKWADATDLMDRCRASHNPDNLESLERVLAPYRSADVLLLDDITGERPTFFAQEEMFRLVKHRYDYQKPMVITTNLDMNEMERLWGRRLADRLYDEATGDVRVVRLQGASYRTGRQWGT